MITQTLTLEVWLSPRCHVSHARARVRHPRGAHILDKIAPRVSQMEALWVAGDCARATCIRECEGYRAE